MENVLNLWNAWSIQRRVGVIGAFMVAGLIFFMLSRIASAPTMSLLYAGLDSAAAGEVVRELDAQGAAYEVRGGSIYVDARQRDTLRIKLAADGLPANGGQGYELLDSLSGFSTTAQMFDAAYWRAKEGELARTITAAPAIRSARVHIANGPSNPFQRNMKPSASVTISSATGALAADQARALQYLVASAVSGLQPEDVAVIDSEAGLIETDQEQSASATELDRSERLRERALRLLEARVGPGNAVVEITVDTVTESEQIVERRFNPEERVPISTDTETRTSQSQQQGAAGVTIASNLPEGDAGAEDSATRNENENRERVNYEVSETRREITRRPGDIARISIAVLVNGTSDAGGAFIPRPDEELAALGELVSSALGVNLERGDSLTIRSMPFVGGAALSEGGALVPGAGGLTERLDMMSLIQLAALVFIALIMLVFVLRPLLLRQPTNFPAVEAMAAANVAAIDPATANADPNALTGEIEEGSGDFNMPEMSVVSSQDELSELPDLGLDFALPELGSGADSPIVGLRNLINERPKETLELLRSWIETEDAEEES